MATIEQQLNQLTNDKKTLVANLVIQGVEATEDETFTSLVPKVLDIETGGVEVEKGLKILEYDENGYVTSVELVGMTKIPDHFFNGFGNKSNMFSKVGGNLKLPVDLIEIGISAFYDAYIALTELPSGITTIKEYAFYNNQNLALTKLPSGITKIESNTFYNNKKLALTELPSGLISIGEYAFYNNQNLSIKEIPIGVTELPQQVFRDCYLLTYLDILSPQLSSIGASCFRGSEISTLVIRAINPPTITTNTFQNTPISLERGYVYVPDESIEAYKTATNWSTYANQIKGLSELPEEYYM